MSSRQWERILVGGCLVLLLAGRVSVADDGKKDSKARDGDDRRTSTVGRDDPEGRPQRSIFPGSGQPPRPPHAPQPPGGWTLPRQQTGHMIAPGMPPSLRAQDPEMAELEDKDRELERQTQELAEQVRRASGEQRETLKKELAQLVQKHFEAREARRELQLKRLEAELQSMRDSMKKRVELRDQIIDRRVSELVGERSELDF